MGSTKRVTNFFKRQQPQNKDKGEKTIEIVIIASNVEYHQSNNVDESQSDHLFRPPKTFIFRNPNRDQEDVCVNIIGLASISGCITTQSEL